MVAITHRPVCSIIPEVMRSTSMGSDSFVHLHVHSKFSLDDGVATVEDLVAAAAGLGMTTLALTDHNSVAGAVAFRRACRKAGIRPIYGAELDILPAGADTYIGKVWRYTILAENDSGYGNLVSLLSEAWRNAGPETPPHLSLARLAEKRSGLIMLTGGPRTELHSVMSRSDVDALTSHIQAVLQLFEPERLAFEVSDFGQVRAQKLNAYLDELSRFFNIPLVATNDVHYILPDDEFAWRFLRGIPIQGPIYPNKFFREEKPRHLATEAEMRKRLPAFPHALRNTVELAERCQVRLLGERRRFPVHDFERGRDADSDLWDKAFQRATQIYGGLTDRMKERLNLELDFIRKEGLADYYQLLFHISRHLADENIARGAGQGRLLTSMVAYVMGLTEIDPLEYKLQFFGERRLPQEDGDAPPPIFSIALPTRSINHVFRFLRESYGEKHVVRVGRYPSSHKGKLFSQLCGWAQLPRTVVHELISQNILDGRGRQPGGLLDLLDQTGVSFSVKNPRFLAFLVTRLHRRLLPISAGDGRLIISGEDLDRITPRVRVNGEEVAQIEADDLLAFGMPQIHLESNPLLNVLDEALKWIRMEHGKEVDLQRIPLDDKAAFELIGSGLTNGVPPLQSAGVKTLLRRYNPTALPQLVKIKLEMAPDDEQVTTDQFTNIFMECLLAYRCAYLKAHYPVSYMTAILNSRIRNRKDFAVLWREIGRMGIRPHLLNINNSPYEFAQANMTIRVGLRVVQLLGEKTFEEIERVRRGGDYESIADFCRRTDPHLVTRPVIENLIRAGAFDCFSQTRAQMLLSLSSILDASRPRTLTDQENQDLFSAMGVEAYAMSHEPEVMTVAEVPLQNLLNDERRITGFVLTRSPLEPYQEFITRCRAILRHELAPRHCDRQVFLAGHIDDTDRDTIALEGGANLLIDFEGLAVYVQAREAERYGVAIFSGLPVLIGGKIRMRGPDPVMTLTFCGQLRDLVVQARHTRKIVLNLNREDKATMKLVYQTLKRFHGETEVAVTEPEGPIPSRRWLARILAMKVFWCPPLAHELRQILSDEHITVESDME